jgi:hypothetical protein
VLSNPGKVCEQIIAKLAQWVKSEVALLIQPSMFTLAESERIEKLNIETRTSYSDGHLNEVAESQDSNVAKIERAFWNRGTKLGN